MIRRTNQTHRWEQRLIEVPKNRHTDVFLEFDKSIAAGLDALNKVAVQVEAVTNQMWKDYDDKMATWKANGEKEKDKPKQPSNNIALLQLSCIIILIPGLVDIGKSKYKNLVKADIEDTCGWGDKGNDNA